MIILRKQSDKPTSARKTPFGSAFSVPEPRPNPLVATWAVETENTATTSHAVGIAMVKLDFTSSLFNFKLIFDRIKVS